VKPRRMHLDARSFSFSLALSALLLCCSCQRPTSTTPPHAAAPSAWANIGFASRERLLEHYQKHGAEFGAVTIEEYLRQAQALRDSPVGGSVLEAVRSDGVTTRFDRSTGAFIAFNSDGTIRTCFKPNNGENYFRRQQQRGE
jgi:pyocin large subunit-like protein